MKDISSATTWTSFLQNVLGLIYVILFQHSIPHGRVVSFCFNGTLYPYICYIIWYSLYIFKQKCKTRYLLIYFISLLLHLYFICTSVSSWNVKRANKKQINNKYYQPKITITRGSTILVTLHSHYSYFFQLYPHLSMIESNMRKQ